MSNKLHITTTLPYVNAEPHIGHALEFIQADAINRYFKNKLGKDNVFFNIGTDEHGQKILNKALEEGLNTTDFTNKYSQRFKDFCQLFEIVYDNFYRTSQSYHVPVAQGFWQKSMDNGDIYKKSYSGLYCIGCEAFKTPKDLVDGLCPDHKKAPVAFSEENYFFKLSKYKQHLLDRLSSDPDFLKPSTRINEVTNFIKDLEDISVSRLKKNLPRGIEVPNDPEQIMYVRFDALSNYIGAVGFPNDMERFNELWPNTLQLCGPDNVRFQAIVWQGMLASAGFPHTKKLLVHGMILGPDGNKMSKSMGNVVSPFEQLEKYGSEAIRFYMLYGIPTTGDASYKEEDLVNIYNSCLADSYGNLLNRVIHLSIKKEIKLDLSKVSGEFKSQIDELETEVKGFFDDLELQSAINSIHKISLFSNKYTNDNKPRDAGISQQQAEQILNNLYYAIDKITELYSPIIPLSTDKAKQALANQEKIILFEKITLN